MAEQRFYLQKHMQQILESQATGHPCTMVDLKQFIMTTWKVEMDRRTRWRSLDRDPRITSYDERLREDK
jgi:hypothetical protein